jgi:hypothetical protein
MLWDEQADNTDMSGLPGISFLIQDETIIVAKSTILLLLSKYYANQSRITIRSTSGHCCLPCPLYCTYLARAPIQNIQWAYPMKQIANTNFA